MGFFSEIASEARRGMACSQAQTPVRQAASAPPPAALEPEPAPPVATETLSAQPIPAQEAKSEPVSPPASPEPETMPPAPAESEQGPAAVTAPPKQPAEPQSIDLTPEADTEDEAQRKRDHETAEARRKAEFDAKQAEKKRTRQEQLDKLAAMSDAELLAASAERVAADTEKLTRRNMKEAVAEHIQGKCRGNAAFARLVMDPDKSMINCFQYINRKAREFAEQEMKDLGIERTGTYGCDVPDGLCFQWAEDYFNDSNAKEDHKDDEKFVPKPYVPTHKAAKTKTAKAKSDKKKPAPEMPKPKGFVIEQASLF